MRFLLPLIILFAALPATAQNPLAEIVEDKRQEFSQWVSDPDKYEIQVLYTEIERLGDGEVRLTTHRWGTDSSRYFYPASTVKMPAAVLALQRIRELGVEGLSPQTPLFHSTGYAPASSPQTAVRRDSTTESGFPTVENYVRKIFLVSDNDAYNRLFEFLGPTYLNTALAKVGVDDSRLLHRVGVGGFNTETHAWLNPVSFVDGPDVLYAIGERHDEIYFARTQVQAQVKGQGYQTNDGTLISEPFDFRRKNYLSLRDLQGILARIVVPEAFDAHQRFQLLDEDYRILRGAMRQRPRESERPVYDKPDNHVKFWLYGDKPEETRIPDDIRILNKVGWAYGYLTDAAYIRDESTGVEFMLVGTIHVNENQIYNDGEYEYDEVGLPFFGELGRAVLDYERRKVDGKR